MPLLHHHTFLDTTPPLHHTFLDTTPPPHDSITAPRCTPLLELASRESLCLLPSLRSVSAAPRVLRKEREHATTLLHCTALHFTALWLACVPRNTRHSWHPARAQIASIFLLFGSPSTSAHIWAFASLYCLCATLHALRQCSFEACRLHLGVVDFVIGFV
jgi:hypothetical protein